jgi:hypothetical protein
MACTTIPLNTKVMDGNANSFSGIPSVPTHSFASHGEIGQDLFCAVAFENDGLGRCGPYEGFWMGVSMIDPFDDGGLKFGDAAKDASALDITEGVSGAVR